MQIFRKALIALSAVATAWASAAPATAQSTATAAGESSANSLTDVLALQAPPIADQASLLTRLHGAIEAWDEGDRLAGAVLADSVLALFAPLRDWRPLIVAELLVPTSDTARVRSTLQALDRDGDLWQRWGWSVLVDAYEEAGDLEAARNAAREQAERALDADRSAEAWLRAGQLSLQSGDSLAARGDLWTVLYRSPASTFAGDAARLIDRLPPGLPDREEDVALGRALLDAGAWGRAYSRLSPYLDSESVAEDTPIDDELRLGLGRGLVELSRFTEAESLLAPLTGVGVPARLSSPALYWTGRAELERGAVDRSADTFRRLAEADPDSYFAERGMLLLLSRELETGFGPRARGFLDELLDLGVRDTSAGATVVRLGTTQYMSKDYPSAATVFERYLARSRTASQRQQAGYWAALTREQEGEASQSRTLLEQVHQEEPLTFYGMLAGERLGAPVLPPDLPGGPPSSVGPRQELENALLRLHVLRIVPTAGAFAFELARLTRHFATREDGDYSFAEALGRGGFPLQGIVLGRDIQEREGAWNLRLLRIVYPFPHRDEIVQLAADNGLDPFFVAGLIRQESAFDAEIESVAGATGLMQLMPATAEEVARSLHLDFASADLTDPDTNLKLGITYLASMVRRFERAEDVLSAYNAGPGRMRQWEADPTHADPEVFIENIPYDQTRDYVKGVQRYTRVYTALYGCADFQPCLGLPYAQAVARSSLAKGAPRTERTLD